MVADAGSISAIGDSGWFQTLDGEKSRAKVASGGTDEVTAGSASGGIDAAVVPFPGQPGECRRAAFTRWMWR
jgi:hypothetical protein